MHTKEFAKYDQLHSSTVYQMTDFIKSNDTLVMKSIICMSVQYLDSKLYMCEHIIIYTRDSSALTNFNAIMHDSMSAEDPRVPIYS